MIKKRQIIYVIRELFLFSLLFTLIGYAGKRMNQFIILQKNSYIHELDRTFVDYLQIAQQQLRKTRDIIYLTENDNILIEQKITTLQKYLSSIEERYRTNSPSLALLGPIGTIAIIVKEQKLAQQLHKIVHEIGTILYNCLKTTGQPSYQLLPSIEANLRTNKALLKQLHSN
ncbi:MAG: hypothetical protein WCD44_02850 [Candidatus Babeliales bacterium]